MSSTPCYICGKGMEEVRLDGRDLKPRPCTTCEEIISETAGTKKDIEPGMTWGELALILCNDDEEKSADGETNLGDPEGG